MCMWHVHFKHKLRKMQNFKLVICEFAITIEYRCTALFIQCATQCRQQQNATMVLALTESSVQHCTSPNRTSLQLFRSSNESIDQTTQISIKSCRIIIHQRRLYLELQLKFNLNNVDYFVWQTKSFESYFEWIV